MAETQTYQNHVRRTPAIYGIAFLVLLVNILWSGYRMIAAFSFDSVLALLVAVAIVIVLFAARTQTLTVQNRVIRLEERLRYERLLTPDIAARATALPLPQIIALRFASDMELPALLADVFAGQLTAPKDIKMRVKDWRADFLRA